MNRNLVVEFRQYPTLVEQYRVADGVWNIFGPAKGASLVEPIDGNHARAWFEHGTTNRIQVYLFSGTPTREGFHQYTYIRNGNQHRIFIDGEIAGTSLFDQGPNDTPETPFPIEGMVSDKNGTPFAGIIYEVRI